MYSRCALATGEDIHHLFSPEGTVLLYKTMIKALNEYSPDMLCDALCDTATSYFCRK